MEFPGIWTVIDTIAAFCVIASPHDPSEVWWSRQGGYLCKYSTTEQSIVKVIPVDTIHPMARITNIVFDPNVRRIMYAAGIMMQGVARSTDDGATWHNWFRRPPNRLMDFTGESVQLVTRNNLRRFVCADGVSGRIYYSDNEGIEWKVSPFRGGEFDMLYYAVQL